MTIADSGWRCWRESSRSPIRCGLGFLKHPWQPAVETQLTRQIGEHLVAAKLGRRGLIAAPFAGNVPMFGLLVADEHGRAIPIQVKAINGPAWQFSADQFLRIEFEGSMQRVRERVILPYPGLVCVFVLLNATGSDEFYIFRMSDLQDFFCETYKDRVRPKNPTSLHCAVWPKNLSQHKDRWELIAEALNAVRPAL